MKCKDANGLVHVMSLMAVPGNRESWAIVHDGTNCTQYIKPVFRMEDDEPVTCIHCAAKRR